MVIFVLSEAVSQSCGPRVTSGQQSCDYIDACDKRRSRRLTNLRNQKRVASGVAGHRSKLEMLESNHEARCSFIIYCLSQLSFPESFTRGERLLLFARDANNSLRLLYTISIESMLRTMSSVG